MTAKRPAQVELLAHQRQRLENLEFLHAVYHHSWSPYQRVLYGSLMSQASERLNELLDRPTSETNLDEAVELMYPRMKALAEQTAVKMIINPRQTGKTYRQRLVIDDLLALGIKVVEDKPKSKLTVIRTKERPPFPEKDSRFLDLWQRNQDATSGWHYTFFDLPDIRHDS